MMKKTFLLLVTLTLSMLVVNAQQAFENKAKLDKTTTGACVSIKVPANVKDAQKVMETVLKNENLKGGKSSSKKIAYETPLLFSTISPNYIILYVTFEETSKDKKTPVTTVNLFVKKGPDAALENSSSDAALIANERTFLDQKYYPAVLENNTVLKTADKKKEIEKSKKEIEKLQKQVDSKKKETEKAKANISKSEKEIENTTKSIEDKQQGLNKLQEELKQIK
ncbi:MAG: hypothetical protein LBN18_01805 [Dysgonamonadaceae bacterium]|jgi:valyl-tRNA synthetase|nr:hypothetical protein [Dysgonamonadaceae bacterium]